MSKTKSTTTKGKINVQTENIFPIIKKFLYSDNEIFLRELVSNAVDATKKLKALASMGEVKGDLGDTKIEVVVDKAAKTITIKDKGLGMTAEEIDKYIAQIAFSGAEEFVNKYKDKVDKNVVIGHFGLGFYSAFMVAKQVEIFSLSYKEGAKAVRWECDGSPEYQVEEIETKTQRGTDIVLHIADDCEEFLDDHKIEGLLTKYCKFLPVEIKFGTKKDRIKPELKEGEKEEDVKEVEIVVDNIINNPAPAWTKKPTDLSPENYKSFYHELYPMQFEEPLFHIHLNVDYPFNLTGILYFPKLSNKLEMPKDRIQLYSNQVFVTDNVENIVPDFLTLLRGVIDSPDIPLNVSRSYLQADSNVKKISSHITKKVADKLEELFKKERPDFEKKWDDIKIFVQYGMISDEKFYEKAIKFALLKTTDNKYFTFEEFENLVKPIQTDKDKKLIYLYATNVQEQHAYIDAAKSRGYEVLLMETMLDPHYINQLEGKLKDISFVRVDADTIDKLIKKDENTVSKITEEQQKQLQPIIEGTVSKDQFMVSFENLSEKDAPMVITRPEFMRRMKDMNQMGGGGAMGFYGNMPDMYNLVVNSNHPLITKILDEKNTEKQTSLAKQATDLALLSQGLLKGESLTNFIKRSVELI
ncbi:MAG: molecular chaperone HtpG [Bacteroidota bacterium]|nr:molecular chaperone HtpG [Bacteroidota bacterium]MDP3145922.1 molecular chaperone HtpG [Bacteroidota bacterium]MDP3558558.1 molecular chaperone HtpG [Bacteroidota bacterium]